MQIAPVARGFVWIGLLAGVLACRVGIAAEPTAEELDFFETKIRPVLVKECYGCHSNKTGNARGGLRLDTKQLTHVGGSSGPAIVPGDLEQSLLYNAITHQDFVMPPKRKLSPEVIADFRKWIESGAADPRETVITEIKSTIAPEDIEQARHSFWAYQPPRMPSLPTVDNAAWPNTEVDHFVLARLQQAEMLPAADAAANHVLRRLCFDLVGLPPTPQQLEWFDEQWQRDPDDAVAMVVERLLQKPQFGERWGRHWLDVARYAESTGREVNMTYPHAWRYRDYVIDSFNADKPFNQFVQEQLAGDLLPAKDDAQWAEQLIGTAFLAMGAKNVNEQNRVQFANDLIDEQIDTTTRVFLGTSVACARCHDHKFDAIPQTDYYAMAGIFRNMTTYFGNPPSDMGGYTNVQARRASSLLQLPVQDPRPVGRRYTAQELADLKQEFADTEQELLEARRQRRSGGQTGGGQMNALRLQNRMADLSAQLAVVDDDGNPRSYCMGVQEQAPFQDARVLIRGEIDQPGQVVARGVPQVLCEQPLQIDPASSGRLELARWIGSEQNPLTARVMVNRIWQTMMGRGIVTSTENFGVTGASPSHPELLDYLAVRFMQSDWSVKEIVREIATSRIYRVASDFNPEYHQRDPDNALLWRANAKRLDAEAIRDSMLSISGELDLERPVASVVAEAGYVRVRDGVLGDPRQQIRKQVEEIRQQALVRARQRSGDTDGRGQFERGQFGRGQFGRGPFGRGQAGRGPAGRGQGGRGEAARMREVREATQREMQTQLRELARQAANALDMEDAKFRSVYLPIVRDEEPRCLEVFDFADANSPIGTRETSNTANQALYMMNNPFVIQQSQSLAERIAKRHRRFEDRIDEAFRLTFARLPTASESSAAARLMRDLQSTTDDAQALAVLCQSLFASAEFRFID
ncbi:PSD1 and planctomycete cytochrome C domain-containing protein [Roseimaritima ulvae]|uniref:Planctomycete cytochrome C n=1 Tax=Roseimaritima ulvae TaxID=980254 RepID=A0A5B9QWC1_9BACT|nr:PSD1 and planctomycete cytochrome C domain-containing protein [Roseimaritima ulvae]QEG43334.1 Planctomycete cytochrome C [Roseimaritima ulvae]